MHIICVPSFFELAESHVHTPCIANTLKKPSKFKHVSLFQSLLVVKCLELFAVPVSHASLEVQGANI